MRNGWLWLALYGVIMAGTVWAVFTVRTNVLRDFDTPEARAEWQAWRDAQPNQPDSGPVARRPPKATEPPTLVLLRDYFGVMLFGAVFFTSLLFGATAFVVRGVIGTADGNRATGQR